MVPIEKTFTVRTSLFAAILMTCLILVACDFKEISSYSEKPVKRLAFVEGGYKCEAGLRTTGYTDCILWLDNLSKSSSWHVEEVKLNDVYSYSSNIGIVAPSKRIELDFLEFTTSDGTRFDFNSTKPLTVTISALEGVSRFAFEGDAPKPNVTNAYPPQNEPDELLTVQERRSREQIGPIVISSPATIFIPTVDSFGIGWSRGGSS